MKNPDDYTKRGQFELAEVYDELQHLVFHLDNPGSKKEDYKYYLNWTKEKLRWLLRDE